MASSMAPVAVSTASDESRGKEMASSPREGRGSSFTAKIASSENGGVWLSHSAARCASRLLVPEEEIKEAESKHKLSELFAKRHYSEKRDSTVDRIQALIGFIWPEGESEDGVEEIFPQRAHFLTECETIIEGFEINNAGGLVSKRRETQFLVPLCYSDLIRAIIQIQRISFESMARIEKGVFFTLNHCQFFAIMSSRKLHFVADLILLQEGSWGTAKTGYHLSLHRLCVLKRNRWLDERDRVPSKKLMIEEYSGLIAVHSKLKSKGCSWIQEAPIVTFKVASDVDEKRGQNSYAGFISTYYECGDLDQWRMSGHSLLERVEMCLRVLTLFSNAETEKYVVRDTRPKNLFLNRKVLVFGDIGSSGFWDDLEQNFRRGVCTDGFSNALFVQGMIQATDARDGKSFVRHARNNFGFSILGTCYTLLSDRELECSPKGVPIYVALPPDYDGRLNNLMKEMVEEGFLHRFKLKLALESQVRILKVKGAATSSSSSSKQSLPLPDLPQKSSFLAVPVVIASEFRSFPKIGPEKRETKAIPAKK